MRARVPHCCAPRDAADAIIPIALWTREAAALLAGDSRQSVKLANRSIAAGVYWPTSMR